MRAHAALVAFVEAVAVNLFFVVELFFVGFAVVVFFVVVGAKV